MPCRRLPLRRFISGLAAFWLLAALTLPGTTTAQQPGPEQKKEIADLEKQIDALTKKLNDLKTKSGVPTPTPAAPEALNAEWLKALTWRSIGPASMGGRITALAVYEADPITYWVATASGGLLRTTNNGVTFEHQFDREATVSIGDVAVAQSDRNIVWVGTGEANPRNSVSFGDGVYKSTNGGKTWQNMGLKKSFQVGRIAIHPKDPNIVYVGALGRLYGASEERGLFKTTDGGKSWQKVLYVDDKTGVIDLAMHPTEPDTLLVATWERQRDAFDSFVGSAKETGPPPIGFAQYDPIKKWGQGTAIHKTTDGGKTFKKLTQGLPTSMLGRIGLDYYRKDPNVVFAIIDCEKIGMAAHELGYLGVQGQDADAGARLTQLTKDGPAEKAGLKVGDIVLAIDNKPVLSYKQFVDVVQDRKAGDKVTFKLSRNREAQEVVVTLARRPGGLPGVRSRPYTAHLGGQAENVQDKQGPDGFQYGGIYKSTDGGESWTRINSLNPRPMYFSLIRVDPSDDKHLYVGGIALYRSADGGKTFKDDAGKGVHPDHHAMWIDPRDGRHMIVGCDGGVYVSYDRMDHWDFHNHFAIGQYYHVALDTRQPYHVYGGLQDNGSWGGPSRTLRATGAINEDWYMVGGGDGFVCRVDPSDPDVVYYESQDGNIMRRNLKTGEFRPLRTAQGPYRFNWNTPFILSQHNPRILYAAGNVVLRSVKRGEELRPCSPEITRTKRGSGSALAESPRNPDVLWVGADDGALCVTRDGGGKWTNVADKVGLPGPRWVASIEPSRFVEGRAYVAFDAHRSDDDEPYVFVTEDFGQTWKSLRGNLPTGSTRVLREDVQNPNLLYLGTEFAIWVSGDRGQSWQKLNNNLPTVAIHEIAVHPTAGEIVAATHGRSLWVLDVTALRQLAGPAVHDRAYLYQPAPAVRWRIEPSRGSIYGTGSRRFVGDNPPRGAELFYSLTKKADKVTIRVIDINGKTLKELPGKVEPGLHKVVWDLTGVAPRPEGEASKGKGPRRPPGQAPERPVPAGVYRVMLLVDGAEWTQSIRVEADPVVPAAVAAPDFGNKYRLPRVTEDDDDI
jgi:photosystem II stability/assembly factor-like uncharacterized protein